MTLSAALRATCFGFVICLSACGDGAVIAPSNEAQEIRQLTALLDDFALQELSRTPETASRLGLPVGRAGYDYTTQLDDRSQAAFERARLERIEMLEQIDALSVSTTQISVTQPLQIAHDALTNAVQMAGFGHGQVSLGYARPYAADQLSGAYTDLPDLLINRQIITDRQSAIAYVERLARVSDAIDDDARRLKADAQAGIRPPDFILARMAAIATEWATTPEDAEHRLIETFQTLSLSAQDISGADKAIMMREVRRIVTTEIVPAYQRFTATLETLQEAATHEGGIWAIKNGSEYYTLALSFYTGTDQSPEALHADGLAIVASLSAELNTALSEIGLEDGSVGARLSLISQRPDQLYANTDEGRAQLLSDLDARLQAIRTQQDAFLNHPPRTSISVAQVPQYLQSSAPGGYYSAASANGTNPSQFFINLRDTAEWPAFTLPTLLYHETIPGHHIENAIMAERTGLALIRQLIWLPAYGEGWALYAEDVADELGVYTDDPLGRIGYLQSLLFRAARLVADTGMHHKQWSRDETITYMVETTGQSRTAMETEVDRYAVWPGQAASYMVGRQFIWQLRNRAEGTLRSKFNLPDFHDAVLANGPRQNDMVEADVNAWMQSILNAP